MQRCTDVELRQIQALMLTSPPLLRSALAVDVRGLDDFARVLEMQLRLSDLEDLSAVSAGGAPFRLTCASAAFGDVGISAIAGSPIAVSADPILPLCVFALPTAGWGRYQLDRDSVDCVHGETVAFLPARGWRLINDCSGGTGIFFTEQALLARAMAVCATQRPGSFLSRLRQPITMRSRDAATASALRQLHLALEIAAEAVSPDNQIPHPFLQLDDLILRCIAFILFPGLLDPQSSPPVASSEQGLHAAVCELMDWMHAHKDSAISLTQIEQRSGYSRRAIQLGFKRQVGCGPIQWLRRQRLQSAFDQLQNPDPGATVTGVARSCGYLSLASFSRDFSAEFSTTPSALLRQARRSS